MRLEYTLRPTIMRTNARFRGPTESEKYFNTVQETLHDLALLGKVIDRDSFIFTFDKGQSDFIKDNLALYFSGEGEQAYANIPTGTVLLSYEGVGVSNTDLLSSAWTAYGNCTKGGSSTIPRLTSVGTAAPSGVSYNYDAQEGQILYIRASVKKISGNVDNFTIGSRNVNNGIGSVASFKIEEDGYVGFFVECKHKERITINIEVNGSATNAAGVVELQDISISLVSRQEMYLQPINTDIKSKINVLDNEIQNIIKNM